jgi:hypothetical protein
VLLIETYIDISPGKGFGLFSKYIISLGTVFWRRDEAFDKVYLQSQVESFKQVASDYIKIHGFQEVNLNWYLCGDNARFTNHSNDSNSKHHFNSEGLLEYCTASQNIEAGQEILCDYSEICLTCKSGVIFHKL